MSRACLPVPYRPDRIHRILHRLKRGGLLVLPLLLCLMTGCGGDLPLSLNVQADPQLLRLRSDTTPITMTRGWFVQWSRVVIAFINRNSTQRHRIIMVQGNPAQITVLVAAAAQRPDYAPTADPAVLSATPLVPPSKRRTFDLRFFV